MSVVVATSKLPDALDEITGDWVSHGFQRGMALQGPKALPSPAASGILVSQGLKI